MSLGGSRMSQDKTDIIEQGRDGTDYPVPPIGE